MLFFSLCHQETWNIICFHFWVYKTPLADDQTGFQNAKKQRGIAITLVSFYLNICDRFVLLLTVFFLNRCSIIEYDVPHFVSLSWLSQFHTFSNFWDWPTSDDWNLWVGYGFVLVGCLWNLVWNCGNYVRILCLEGVCWIGVSVVTVFLPHCVVFKLIFFRLVSLHAWIFIKCV